MIEVRLGRPKILPLPDRQATLVIQGLQRIREDLNQTLPGSRNPDIWESLVELVHQATGQIFGHQTYRELLKIYGNEFGGEGEGIGPWSRWPGTTTLQSAIAAVRARAPQASLRKQESYPNVQSLPTLRPSRSIRAATDATNSESGESREMERFLRIDIENLRSELASERAQRIDAVTWRDHALKETSEATSQLVVLRAVIEEQRTANERLTAALERMQNHTDASHKYALLQVDRVRNETRQAYDDLAAAKQQLVAVQKMLVNERTVVDNYRRQVNELRARVGEGG